MAETLGLLRSLKSVSRSKRISVDLSVRREQGKGPSHGTRKGTGYVVLTLHSLKRTDIWLTPAEAKKLAEYINRES